MDPLGLENVTKAVNALTPVLDSFADSLGKVIHGVFNRLNGTTITITVQVPPAVGGIANPPTD